MSALLLLLLLDFALVAAAAVLLLVVIIRRGRSPQYLLLAALLIALAAANAMSDVYAMGGEVLFALQIAAWPEDAPIAQLERVFAGAVDTVREAGGVVAGGHTVIDREPKFGLAVTGRVDPQRILRKD